jgi:hypothetical protein
VTQQQLFPRRAGAEQVKTGPNTPELPATTELGQAAAEPLLRRSKEVSHPP